MRGMIRRPRALACSLLLAACTSTAPDPGPPGTGGSSTAGAGGISGAGSGGAAAGTGVNGGNQPTAGDAHVRFCPDSAAETELQIGDKRLKAGPGACAPAAGMSCVAVPAGRLQVSYTVGGQTVDQGTQTLAAGKSYLVEFLRFTHEGKRLLLANPLELTDRAECDRLDPKEAAFRLDKR